MDALELARRYKVVIEDNLGLVAEIQDNGDVWFKSPEHGRFVVNLFADNDPEYFRLVFLNVSGSSVLKEDVSTMHEYMNRINRQFKGVKIW